MSIRFRFNAQKALEVILWFAEKNRGISFHTLLKLLFYADKYHLNQYGRPIVGDRYVALPYGPVAQMTYDILKGEPLALEALEMQRLPFEVRGRYNVFPTERGPDSSKFSESDVEALEYAWNKYGDYGFNILTRLTHNDPAYKNAEGQTIRYEDFLEGPNISKEVIEELQESAPRIVI